MLLSTKDTNSEFFLQVELDDADTVLDNCLFIVNLNIFMFLPRELLCVWTPCAERFLPQRPCSEPPNSSTRPLFVSLRLVSPSDQTPPRQPPPATCSTSTLPQHLHLRCKIICIAQMTIFGALFSIVVSVFLSSRFPVRRTHSTCTCCLLSKIPVWERWSPTLPPLFSMLSVLYRYN